MIYVVRHGQTDWNLEGRFQGRIDIPLNEKGKSQAKKTKEKLEGIKFRLWVHPQNNILHKY